MPITDSGQKMLNKLRKQYGGKEGESIFYKMLNKGKKGSEKWHKTSASAKIGALRGYKPKGT